MKFTIKREDLLSPLQQLVGVIEKRQTMPILSNVLLQIENEQLTLVGTDLEIQLVVKIPIEGASMGAITVPARKFLDICRLLPLGALIIFEVRGDKVKISSNKSRFSLSCLPAENYPEFSESPFETRFHINAGKFKKYLDKTIFCMANQDVRYYLNGLLLHISNQTLKLVASDGHRLSIYEDQLNAATNIESRLILPRKGVLELVRLLDDPDIDLEIEFSANNIRIFNKNIVFSAKLVDSKYPDFSKVFQQQFSGSLTVHKNTFKEALTRVAILSNEKFKGVTLDINADSLKISTHNPEHEEAEEELLVEYTGEVTSISFNAQYVLEALSNIDSDQAILIITDNANTCFIEDPNEKAYRFIVMPMKL